MSRLNSFLTTLISCWNSVKNTLSRSDSEILSEEALKVGERLDEGDIEGMRELLLRNPELINGHEWLKTAAYTGDIEMAKMLLDIGCDIEETAKFGKHKLNPLTSAVTGDAPHMVKFLLERGAIMPPADILITAIVGRKQKSLEIVKVFDEHGIDLNHVSINEMTGELRNVLSMANDYGKEDLVEYLRSRGCASPETGVG